MANTFDVDAFEQEVLIWDAEDAAVDADRAATGRDLTADERDMTAPPGFTGGGTALRDPDTNTFL